MYHKFLPEPNRFQFVRVYRYNMMYTKLTLLFSLLLLMLIVKEVINYYI